MARRLRDTPPLRAFFCFLLAGWGLVLVSYVLNLHSVAAPIGGGLTRKVGYIAAINWSLNYAVILPSVAFGMLATLQAVPQTLKGLARRGMLRSPDFVPERNPAALIARWNKDNRATVVLLSLVVGVVFAASLVECVHNNLIPLARQQLDPQNVEVDWGLAALYSPVNGGAFANGVFDTLAFLLQAVLFSSILGFFVLMIDFQSIITYASDEELLLVPQLDDDDSRLGFGQFEDMLQKMVVTAMFAYLMCLTTRLQNLYLLSHGYTSIWEFVKGDFFAGFRNGWSEVLPSFFTVKMGAFASVMVVFSALVLFLLVLAVCAVIVQSGARQAQGLALGNVKRLLEGQAGSPVPQGEIDKALLRLHAMRVWPIRWLSLNKLLLVCAFAAISLFFYRLAVFTSGLIVLSLTSSAFKAIKKIGGAPQGLPAQQ